MTNKRMISDYFQIKEYQKAASAAFTYLVAHPDDKIIQTALKQYSLMEQVNMNEIINYDAQVRIYK